MSHIRKFIAILVYYIVWGYRQKLPLWAKMAIFRNKLRFDGNDYFFVKRDNTAEYSFVP